MSFVQLRFGAFRHDPWHGFLKRDSLLREESFRKMKIIFREVEGCWPRYSERRVYSASRSDGEHRVEFPGCSPSRTRSGLKSALLSSRLRAYVGGVGAEVFPLIARQRRPFSHVDLGDLVSRAGEIGDAASG